VTQDPAAPPARLHIQQAAPGTDEGRLAVVAEALAAPK